MKKQTWGKLALILFLLWTFGYAQAQETQPDGPVYIAQAGDTLWSISLRFGVSMDDLASKNGIADPNQLAIGAHLVIPGLEGLQGVLVTQNVPFGENLLSLSRHHQIPVDLMARLNHYTSPEEVYAGSTVIIPDRGEGDLELGGGRATLRAGQSLLELAVTRGVHPWALLAGNQLPGSSSVLPGDTLYLSGFDDDGPGALPDSVSAVEISAPLIQGQTLVLELNMPEGASLHGRFHEYDLNFFRTIDGDYIAMQGIHAMLAPGLYPLTVDGELADGTPLRFSQSVYVQDGNYPYDPPLVVNSETMDIENTQPENEQWYSLVKPVTAEKSWDGIFKSPVPDHLSKCFPSLFGNRRSYNQSGYHYFHTGLDFCGSTGVDIYAPVPGLVVFAGPLMVRGNATVIDHGWGVYTAYAHQSEILVEVGEYVETGQLIGLVGETGRVTGPHLHWEVIVGGVQVDPLQWLRQEFP